MIGQRYWTTGISVKSDARHGFIAWLDFFDDGFAEPGSSQGRLEMRYFPQNLAEQLDTLIRDAQALGIEFKTPTLYWQDDGEDPKNPPPADWRQLLAEQCDRLGWRHTYRQPAAAE